MADAIGWFSSVVLLATILNQVRAQWVSNARVSKWLFVGQAIASLGFTTYSLLLKNWVFTLTNASLLVSAGLGCWISLRRRRLGAQAGKLPACPTVRAETQVRRPCG